MHICYLILIAEDSKFTKGSIFLFNIKPKIQIFLFIFD